MAVNDIRSNLKEIIVFNSIVTSDDTEASTFVLDTADFSLNIGNFC